VIVGRRVLLNILIFGMTNAAMERFNATVAKAIASGHGYRNVKYLFLKLRQMAKNAQQFHPQS